jgi:pyruvate/2-oxoglutarate dehydrogenase complex dihydrolipoamide acyltransferase (E2) component
LDFSFVADCIKLSNAAVDICNMGEIIPLSKARRAMVAMLRYAQKIPTVPVARTIHLGPLAQTRKQQLSPHSWSAIFIRAYGLVCSHFPHLRRAWMSWPFPRLYEHPHSVCGMAVEREWEGEKVVLKGLIREPEHTSLDQISMILRGLQEADVWSVSSFRSSLRFGAVPGWLQRLLMWQKLDVNGTRRAKYIGTFGFSNYGMLGAESLHPIGPTTTVMTLSPIKPNGDVTVKLVYDHRVLDGSYVARCLAHLEEVLHQDILLELRGSDIRVA